MRKTMKGRKRKGRESGRRSPQGVKTYKNLISATVAYAHHPETPDRVAAPLLNAPAGLCDRLDEEDWIPKELAVYERGPLNVGGPVAIIE
jgi:hypothetical protein